MTIVALLLFALAMWIAGVSVVQIAQAWSDDPSLDRTVDEDAVLRDVRELLSRKTMLMQLIQATELDLEMGRLDDASAKSLIQRYRREAVRVMRDLDHLQGEPEDVERATELFDARAERAAERIAAGDNAWSPIAARRHGTQTVSTGGDA